MCCGLAASALFMVRAGAVDLPAFKRKTAEDLYYAKCIKCHKHYDPAAYSEKDWEMWMRKMSRKSKLKPEQDALLRRYLGEFRTSPK
jgi:hypothetical protein